MDGRRVRDLARAADLAVEGSRIVLAAGDHQGGVTLPPGVTITGLEARILGDAPLVDARGALTVDGVAFGGGAPVEGGVIRARGDLLLRDVTLDGARGDGAIRAEASLEVLGGAFADDGVVFRTGNAVARSPRVVLTDVALDGIAEVPGDRVDVRGLSGGADLRVSGQALLIQDSALAALDARSPVLDLAGVQVDGAASLYGDDALLLELAGGTWSLDVRDVTAQRWSADAIAGTAERAVLADVEASLVVLEVAFADLRRVRAAELDVSGESLTVDDVAAERLHLFGFGVASRIAARGPAASLTLGPLRTTGAMLHATGGPARLTLRGTDVDGLVVVEPSDTVDAGPVMEAFPFALVEHLTWLGGQRARLTPEGSRLFLGQSVLAGWDLGPLEDASYAGTVLWHLDGSLGPVPLAIVDDPRFVAPGDPHLLPDSPHVGRGAFAGPYAPIVEALWSAP